MVDAVGEVLVVEGDHLAAAHLHRSDVQEVALGGVAVVVAGAGHLVDGGRGFRRSPAGN